MRETLIALLGVLTGVTTESVAYFIKKRGLDMQELIEQYEGDPDRMGKIELAAMTLLKMSDETDADHLLQKSKLRQEGMELLKYVQKAGNTFSIQRVALIHLLEMNG